MLYKRFHNLRGTFPESSHQTRDLPVILTFDSSPSRVQEGHNIIKTIGVFFGYLYSYSGGGIIVEVYELLIIYTIEIFELVITL